MFALMMVVLGGFPEVGNYARRHDIASLPGVSADDAPDRASR
jgi:hypothetical protein